jgi:hypothetical protein
MTSPARPHDRAWWQAARGGALVASLVLASAPAMAQASRCVFLCAPELKVEPTWTVENLWARPRVEVDGVVERARKDTVFELIVAVGMSTSIPRVGVTLEAIFIPFGSTSVHPFTGASAAESGLTGIRDNGIEFEAELNFDLIGTDQSGGWVSSHVDIVDKFSPGETPRAGSTYTHKLNFEWDTAFHVFSRLPSGHWLRHVEAEVSLDYVATGLAKAGDIVSGERFLDDASPWSLSFVFVFPLAPLVP